VAEQNAAKPTDAQRTEKAIKVLREYAEAEHSAPTITKSSTGVMINYARQLVRKAS
jgi:hypothetical protein